MSPAAATPDYRLTAAWIKDGGLMRDWPMEGTCCAQCRFAADRCRSESEAIVAKAKADGRDLTDDEKATVELYAEAYPVLRQSDAHMYPNPSEPVNAVGLPDNKGAATFRYDDDFQRRMARPTTICPRCSTPAAESALRAECIAAGYELNDASVFRGEEIR